MKDRFLSEDHWDHIFKLIEYLKEDEIHYTSKAKAILSVYRKLHISERDLAEKICMSKSEIHRMILIAKLDLDIHEAAIRHRVEKYVLVKLAELKNKGRSVTYSTVYDSIMIGESRHYSSVKGL
jgi:hypothetical protein